MMHPDLAELLAEDRSWEHQTKDKDQPRLQQSKRASAQSRLPSLLRAVGSAIARTISPPPAPKMADLELRRNA